MQSLHAFLAVTAAADAVVWSREEIAGAVARIATGITIPFIVWWIVRRWPWPRRVRAGFVIKHVVAALALASLWHFVGSALVALFMGRSVAHAQKFYGESLFVGCIIYAVMAGILYAIDAQARASRAESLAARTQLAALRAQLQPHFLFNALHTVVQLIPLEPARAADAASLLANLLRTAVDEQRDEVSLEEEWRFVSRYLDIEKLRFGTRLNVTTRMPTDLLQEQVPSFALQALVENAVRHGATPRVAPTEIIVAADGDATSLTLSVTNTGDVGTANAAGATGTGLARLRERLAVLYGDEARLTTGPREGGGYEAVLKLPRIRRLTS